MKPLWCPSALVRFLLPFASSGAGVAFLDVSACSMMPVVIGLWFVWLGHR
ncbi:hypothetical protein [Acinetobacter baumannii]|nr:hypothetical protein [Acinetobacter baumannii]